MTEAPTVRIFTRDDISDAFTIFQLEHQTVFEADGRFWRTAPIDRGLNTHQAKFECVEVMPRLQYVITWDTVGSKSPELTDDDLVLSEPRDVIREQLSEWSDFDQAEFVVGQWLGMWGPDDFQEYKHVFWSNNPLGHLLHGIVEYLCSSGGILVHDENESSDTVFRSAVSFAAEVRNDESSLSITRPAENSSSTT